MEFHEEIRTAKTEQPKQGSQNRITRSGLPEQDSRDKTAKTEQPEQYSKNRTARE
jgi:hypothetical protein